MSSFIHKFGYNDDIDTATDPEDIWDVGGAYTGFVAAAATTVVVSASAADASAGTGIRTVRIQGLDANFKEISEDAVMNGITNVTLANDFLRVFRVYALTAGSGGAAAGNIQVKHGATVLAQITLGAGQTLMAVYTVPKIDVNNNPITFAKLKQFGIGLLKGGAQATFIRASLDIKEEGGVWRIQHLLGHMTGAPSETVVPKVPFIFAPGTDIRLRVIETSADNVAADGWFELELG